MPSNSLQVRFAALTFLQESSVLFRYRMTGVRREWFETNERELNYSGLPPGQYTLESRGAQRPRRVEHGTPPAWRYRSARRGGWLGGSGWPRSPSRCCSVTPCGRRARAACMPIGCAWETAVGERTSELLREKQRLIAEKARSEEQHRQIEQLLAEAQTAAASRATFWPT